MASDAGRLGFGLSMHTVLRGNSVQRIVGEGLTVICDLTHERTHGRVGPLRAGLAAFAAS